MIVAAVVLAVVVVAEQAMALVLGARILQTLHSLDPRGGVMAEPNEEWVTIGELGIDSAHCLLLDPEGIDHVGDWMAHFEDQVQIVRTSTGIALGAIIETGYGDGVYPIEVRYEDDERGDRRVAEVRVRFV